MTSIVKLVQEEVRRLARRETKPELERLKKECGEMRRSISQLTKRLNAVERNGSPQQLPGTNGQTLLAAPAVHPSITAHMVKTLRTRLGLTQANLAGWSVSAGSRFTSGSDAKAACNCAAPRVTPFRR